MLRDNHAISFIHLGCPDVTPACIPAFISALEVNHSLTELIGNDYFFTKDPTMAAALARNKERNRHAYTSASFTTPMPLAHQPLSLLQSDNVGDHVYALAVLPNGHIVSGSSERLIKIWDPASGSCLKTIVSNSVGSRSLVCLPSGRIASGSETIKIWNPESGSCTAELTEHSQIVTQLLVLTDGRLASASFDHSIKITTGICTQTLEGHTAHVYCLAALPDGRLASGSLDNTVKIWNLDSGAYRDLPHPCAMAALTVLKDGKLVSGAADGAIRI